MKEENETEEENISPLLKTEMELLTPANARGKVSRKTSEERGLGMASPTDMHQLTAEEMSSLLRRKFPHFFVRMMVALKDPTTTDARNRGTRKTKSVEFDVSVWNKYVEFPDSIEDNYCDDCLVGIELERNTDNRYRDLKKIGKAFEFSDTLKEIFLFSFIKKKWTRISRRDGFIEKKENCSWSSTLGIDLWKIVKKTTYGRLIGEECI